MSAFFSDMESFYAFLQKRADALAMEAEEVTLAECEPTWKVVGRTIKGLFEGVMTNTFIPHQVARPDRRFFRIAGVNVRRAAGREVSGWSQPMIFDDGDGFVALVIDRKTDDVLIRLKAEPGNVGVATEKNPNTRVLISPPIQFSRGNLEHNERALRGELDEKGQPMKPIPLASLATDGRFLTLDSPDWKKAPEDGGRFYEKVNNYALIDVASKLKVETDLQELGADIQDFAWISISLLRQLSDEGLLNGHLRSVLSLLV